MRHEGTRRPAPFAVLVAATLVVWCAALVAAPVVAARAGTGGPVGPAVGATTVYLAGRLVCHQRPTRSFHLAGHQLPVCARCCGLYLGAAAGAVLAAARRRVASDDRRRLLWLAAAAIPTAASLAVEWSGVAAPANLTRALLALPLGAVAAWTFTVAACADGGPSAGMAHRVSTAPRSNGGSTTGV
ncbi:MAG: DUF2085 domain-containing protein [Vicinamibacterales bacterium]